MEMARNRGNVSFARNTWVRTKISLQLSALGNAAFYFELRNA